MKSMRWVVLSWVILALGGYEAESQSVDTRPQDSDFTFALGGDALITRKLSVYKEPKYLELIEMIRGADAAFVNLEMLFHDYEPYPMHQSEELGPGQIRLSSMILFGLVLIWFPGLTITRATTVSKECD